MTDSSGSRAGGSIVALCVLAGALMGGAAGQLTIGILAGIAIGAAIAVAVWRRDRRR